MQVFEPAAIDASNWFQALAVECESSASASEDPVVGAPLLCKHLRHTDSGGHGAPGGAGSLHGDAGWSM